MLPSPCRVLIVEDEFTIAMDLAAYVENLGCEPVGPAGSVPQALALAQLEPLSAAIVDFNLRGEPSTPIVRALAIRGIPVILATAYSGLSLPPELASLPRLDGVAAPQGRRRQDPLHLPPPRAGPR